MVAPNPSPDKAGFGLKATQKSGLQETPSFSEDINCHKSKFKCRTDAEKNFYKKPQKTCEINYEEMGTAVKG